MKSLTTSYQMSRENGKKSGKTSGSDLMLTFSVLSNFIIVGEKSYIRIVVTLRVHMSIHLRTMQ